MSSFSNTPSSAAVKGTQVFGPYGKARYAKGTINTAKGFTGQYNDSLTGLDYYNARYYDPVAGVFLSADSMQGNGQGMNPYGYVGGNPETYSDPSGHCSFCIVIAAIAVAWAAGVVGGFVSTVVEGITQGRMPSGDEFLTNELTGGYVGVLTAIGVGVGIWSFTTITPIDPPLEGYILASLVSGAIGGLAATLGRNTSSWLEGTQTSSGLHDYTPKAQDSFQKKLSHTFSDGGQEYRRSNEEGAQEVRVPTIPRQPNPTGYSTAQVSNLPSQDSFPSGWWTNILHFKYMNYVHYFG